MSRLRPDRPHRKVRAGGPVRPANLSSLKPVIDPFRARGGRLPDPDELPPPCPECRCECLWFIDRRTTKAQLVCLECVAYEPDRADAPETGAPLAPSGPVRR